MFSKNILDGLNERQHEAITAPLGNTLVLAGAGSGKTRVLVSRIAWLVREKGFSPQSILAVTFTNKAAGEMRTRLHHLLDLPLHGLWVGTFHGLCNRLLRRHFQEARLPEHFHILDSDDQARLIKRTISSLNLDEEKWPVKQAQAFINSKKDEGLRPSHIHAESFGPTKTWLQIYAAYEQACQTAGVIDFAELVLRVLEILRDNPDLLAHYRQRFQAILVDEFQDTNAVQYAWIRLLADENTSLMAVGDDDQSIYGWRGAKVENIQQFSRDFKDTRLIRLEQNYRSTSTILQAANALISNNDSRMGKDLWTAGDRGEKITVYGAYNELDEAHFVASRIKMAMDKGESPDDIAVLYRSNAQSRVLEEALLRMQVAYRIHGGLRFFDRAEIKDALAYMRLIVNANDDSAFDRVVNFPTRGIGEKTLEEVRFEAKSRQISLWQAAQAVIAGGTLAQRAAKALTDFIKLIEKLKEESKLMVLDEQFGFIIQASGLHAHFAKVKGDKSDSKLDNLQELINAASEYKEDPEENLSLLTAFLSHAALEAGEMQAQENEQAVHLMTLHAAKGLEFPRVFLVGLEEGLFPGKQSVQEPKRLEEERRLCYVGMTRAMENLVLTYAEVRRQYGREEYHTASRFLRELPGELLDMVRANTRFQAPALPKTSQFSRQEEESGLHLGQLVNHAKFGQGIILAVEGGGAHTRVQVKFAADSKWLVLAYANLSMVEQD